MQTSRPAGLSGQWQKLHNLYNEYPRQFWVLVFGTFIDRLGSALVFPFLSLYVTRKFGLGMMQVGLIFGIFSITGMISGFAGGALTDRFGRKNLMLFGIVMSALSSLLLGFTNRLDLFIGVILVVGILADVGFPAQQAMVADLLPEHKRAEGYGIIRVVANLAVTIGPMLGGLLAAYSFLYLFVCDAVSSLITAGIVYVAIHETARVKMEGEPQESIGQTFAGYFKVLRDSAFFGFMLASALMVIVYLQMNTTLSVYLRDVHGVTPQMFGYILSLNAAMVVLFQFAISRRISRYRPMNIMVAGTLLYAIGFAMYGFVSAYVLFLLAMAIITVGEMFVSPVSTAIVSQLAPEDMRGRYMATYGLSWIIPSAIGPFLAGVVMDKIDPHWVWYLAGILGLVAAGGYYLLEMRVNRARWTMINARLDIFQQLEEGQLTAEEAARRLEKVEEGRWAKLAPQEAKAAPQRQLHVRVSEMASGASKADFLLPVGLVNTILYTEGHLSADLEAPVERRLRDLISRAADENCDGCDDAEDHHVEVSLE